MFDAIYGAASTSYDKGKVPPGSHINHPDVFRSFLPCLETYYGRDAFLGFVGKDGRLHRVNSRTGVQQSDPPSAAMYAVGQHPVLMRVADRHEAVFIVAYADNVVARWPGQWQSGVEGTGMVPGFTMD
eukprot:2793376-Rhodomonas_salina.1